MVDRQNNHENCVRYNNTWIPFANINRVYMRRHNDSLEYYFEADVGMQAKQDNSYKAVNACSQSKAIYTTVYGKLTTQQYEKIQALLLENAKKKVLLKKEKELALYKRKKRIRGLVIASIVLVALLVLCGLWVLHG